MHPLDSVGTSPGQVETPGTFGILHTNPQSRQMASSAKSPLSTWSCSSSKMPALIRFITQRFQPSVQTLNLGIVKASLGLLLIGSLLLAFATNSAVLIAGRYTPPSTFSSFSHHIQQRWSTASGSVPAQHYYHSSRHGSTLGVAAPSTAPYSLLNKPAC